MAFVIAVTKKEVNEQMEGLWNITLNLTCENDAAEVINQDFSIRYRTGQDIEVKVKEVQAEMQEVIDDWWAEKGIFDHSKLATAVTYLNSSLDDPTT